MDPRIDRLRGLLAIGVMLGHAIDLTLSSSGNNAGLLAQIGGAVRPYLGFICVVGFIVLSGYCLTRSTLKDFSIGRYTGRRITRLYPLLVIVVPIAGLFEFMAAGSPHRAAMWNGGVDGRTFVFALAGLSGFTQVFGSLAPAYTISYELMYYAVWGIALTTAGGRQRVGWAIAIVISGLLLVFGDELRAALGSRAGFAHPLALSLLPAWLLGATLALFQRHLTSVARLLPPWLLWLALAWMFAYAHDRWSKPVVVNPDVTDVIYYSAIAAMLVLTMASWLAGRAEPGKNDAWLGEISYPLFLVHGPALLATQFGLSASGLSLGFAARLACYIAVSFLLAAILAVCVERPLMAWRRRGRGRQLQAMVSG